MPPIQIPSNAEFELADDELNLNTRTNGDVVTMHPHLSADAAATIAYFVNNHLPVKVEITLL